MATKKIAGRIWVEELGTELRLENRDPRREVTFRDDTAEPNLPSLKRTGRPTTQWAYETMCNVWSNLRLYERTLTGESRTIDLKRAEDLSLIMECARLEEI